MPTSRQPRCCHIRLLPQIGALLFLFLAPLAVAPASAQDLSVSIDFRTTLEPHGRWSHHDRWGEVWIPAHEGEEWAPYTRGRWVYTDDWGWYWVSADEEADWGWVTFHYGRWVYDDEGWIWIPGREWAPAWVTWRRGGDRIGWAPQPPDEIYIEIRDNPRYWVFVEPRDFVSVTLWTEVEPAWRHTELLQQTVIVNRTVVVRERGSLIAVNPGVEPAIIAREVGEPIRTYEVRPRVLAGTADIKDAIEVRPGEAPGELKKQEPVVRETRNLIEPAKTEQPPQALAPGEKGRLGERPPRAAEGVAPGEKKPDEPSKAEEPGKKAEEPTKPEPGKKAEEPSKREDQGKKAEEPSRAEQPGNKAEEPSKREEPGKKAEEPSKEQPGKKAEEPSKREEPSKKAEEPSKAEQPGKKAEEPSKRKEPGKKAEEPSKAEQPGKKAEEPSKREAPGKKAEEPSKEPSKREQPGKRAEEKDKGRAEQPGKKAEQPSKPEGSGKKAEEKGKGAGKKAEGSDAASGGPE